MDDYIYERSDDTNLLIERVVKEVSSKNSLICAEVGFGNGELLLNLVKMNQIKKIYGSDINENSYSKMINNVKSLSDEEKKKISLSYKEYLEEFSNIKFDYIFFNPPYLPSEKNDKYLSENEKKALVGGKKGVETSINFLERIRINIHSNSIILLIVSSLSNNSFLTKRIHELGYDYSIIDKMQFDFEKLFCYKIWPREALKYTIDNNLDLDYLSKGSRSFVYTLKSDNNVVLKQGINDMNSNFKKEFELLEILHDIIRVPKPISLHDNLLLMERIYGIRADKYPDRYSIAVALIDFALVLDAAKIFKKEFSRPFTNLIVNKNNEITIIDFERAVIGKRGNMNQLCEFLKRDKIIDEESANLIRNINENFYNEFDKSLNIKENNESSLKIRINHLRYKFQDKRKHYNEEIAKMLKQE
jgi:predicted Ser/Thr protein kinase